MNLYELIDAFRVNGLGDSADRIEEAILNLQSVIENCRDDVKKKASDALEAGDFEQVQSLCALPSEIKKLSDDPFATVKVQPIAQRENVITRQNAPRTTFAMLGIPAGSKLFFARDSEIQCTTANETNKVEYNGNQYTISALACRLINRDTANGFEHFKYNGKTLIEMRRELDEQVDVTASPDFEIKE